MKLFDQIYPICSMQPSTSRPTITRATIGTDNLHKPHFVPLKNWSAQQAEWLVPGPYRQNIQFASLLSKAALLGCVPVRLYVGR